MTFQMVTAKHEKKVRFLPPNFFMIMKNMESVLTKAAGRDNFIPEEIRSLDERQAYLENFKKVVNVS